MDIQQQALRMLIPEEMLDLLYAAYADTASRLSLYPEGALPSLTALQSDDGATTEVEFSVALCYENIDEIVDLAAFDTLMGVLAYLQQLRFDLERIAEEALVYFSWRPAYAAAHEDGPEEQEHEQEQEHA